MGEETQATGGNCYTHRAVLKLDRLLLVLRLRQSRSCCGLSSWRRVWIAKNFASCACRTWACGLITLRLFRFHGINSFRNNYIKVERKGFEPSARSLGDASRTKPAPQKVVSATPARISLSAKTWTYTGLFYWGRVTVALSARPLHQLLMTSPFPVSCCHYIPRKR